MDEKTVLVIQGKPVIEYNVELLSEAMDEAKRLTVETEQPHTVVITNGHGLVHEVVLHSFSITEYIDREDN